MSSFTVFFATLFMLATQRTLVSSNPMSQTVAGATVCITCGVACPTCEGQWGEWGPWSDCTFQYGVWGKSRVRECIGQNCKGAKDEAIQCAPPTTTTTTTLPPPVWGPWGSWSSCSVSCGGGVQSRTRVCNKVAGQTCDCQGAAIEQRPCNPQACCTWSNWGAWSSCSVTCGAGVSTRQRQCLCSQQCPGSGVEQQPCTLPACQSSCDPGCSTCCISVTCSTCLPSQPCASTCFPSTGSSNVPTIGSGDVPTIGSGNIPTIGSGDVPTIGSGNIPTIGSSNIPTITTRSVNNNLDLIPNINSGSEIGSGASYNDVPDIGNGASYNDVPDIGNGALYDNVPLTKSGVRYRVKRHDKFPLLLLS